MFHTRRIRVRRPGGTPVELALQPGATVADLAELLNAPVGSIDGRPVEPDTSLDAVPSGVAVAQAATGGAPVTLAITAAGPDAGRTWPLTERNYVVGRGPAADLPIDDPTVSRRHARLKVDGASSYVLDDLGSRNGTTTGDVHALGATTLVVKPLHGSPTRHTVIRRPRLAPPPPSTVPAPPVMPEPPPPVKLDLITLAAPLLLAAVMAVLLDPRYAIMGLASPVLGLASYASQRRRQHRDTGRARREAATRLHAFAVALERAHADTLANLRAGPDFGDLVAAAYTGEGLWECRPGHADFLRVTVGRSDLQWTPTYDDRPREISADIQTLLDRRAVLADAPVAVDLTRSLGVEGETATGLARSLVLRIALTHGPADVRIAVLTTRERASEWEWARWLPHCDAGFCGLPLIAAGDEPIAELAEPLAAAIGVDTAPWLVVVIADASLVAERTQPARRLLANQRTSAIVVAAPRWPLPSLCATTLTTGLHAIIELTTVDGLRLNGVRAAEVAADAADELAARLARFRDPEDLLATRLPDSVSLVDLLGLRSTAVQMVVDRWRDSAGDLRIPLGVAADGVLTIDAVHDGPHALVAGTTGAGKSELLRTLVAALAATADADHVNFLLVDFKGGSAFDRAAALPHTVGVITDLDAQLTERALRCLNAELKTREHQLRAAGFDNIVDYQRARQRGADGSPLPRLFVVVDEFAALAAEFPEFIDSLVDIGQRGRSLGVHIILATQRPAGVVKDSLRANANLRIALRLLDVADSRDVIGDPAAAYLTRRTPGRGLARLGPNEVVAFQTASVSGFTPSEPPPPVVIVGSETPAAEGPNDLARLVEAIGEAHAVLGLAQPRRPWPEPLPAWLPLPCAPRDDGCVVFGLADDPDEQRQLPAVWRPARGPLALVGLAGSGTTTALATVALSLAGANSPDTTHFYVLDAGPGDLKPLIDLPHCGAYITLDETERVERLWRLLQRQIDERKRSSATPPATYVLIDNAAALAREEHDYRNVLARLFAEGPAVGVYFAFAADRHHALGHHAEASIAERVLFRLSDRSEYALAGLRNVDGRNLGPGRGYLMPALLEMQVAHAGDLAAAVDAAAARWRHVEANAARITSLPAMLPASALPTRRADHSLLALPIGLLDSTLEPAWLVLRPGDHALVAGPARSGKSNALVALLGVLDGVKTHCIAPVRSALHHRAVWDEAAVASLIERILADLARQVVLIDDADLLDDTAPLEKLMAARRDNVHVIASGRADRLRGLYRHWTVDVRRSRLGVMLRPDEGDGELLGVRLPRRAGVLAPGRGWLIDESGTELVQTALAEVHE